MDFVRGLLNEQRKRLVGTLMQYLEENVYPMLSDTQKRELRGKVIGAVGQYHDAALDMLKVSVNDGSEANDEALRLLRLIHHDLQQKDQIHA
jgi:acetylornithine/succinyldiaminopimelate/putrescine aminotransferase